MEENLHVQFDENKINSAGNGPEWLFDVDMLTKTMNYVPVFAGLDTNPLAGNQSNDSAAKESASQKEFVLIGKLRLGPTISPT